MSTYYSYPLVQGSVYDSAGLSALFGGWGWIDHIMNVLNSNKGMIAKTVVLQKFLKMLQKVPGGSATRAILQPFMNQYARDWDYQTRKQIEAQKAKLTAQQKKKLAQEEKKLDTDFQAEQVKQTGHKRNVRPSNKYKLEKMDDANERIRIQNRIKDLETEIRLFKQEQVLLQKQPERVATLQYMIDKAQKQVRQLQKLRNPPQQPSVWSKIASMQNRVGHPEQVSWIPSFSLDGIRGLFNSKHSWLDDD